MLIKKENWLTHACKCVRLVSAHKTTHTSLPRGQTSTSTMAF